MGVYWKIWILSALPRHSGAPCAKIYRIDRPLSDVGRPEGGECEKLAKALPLAAAFVLLAVVGLFLWRAGQTVGASTQEDAVPAMAGQAGEALALPMGLTREALEQVEDVVSVGEQVEFYTKEELYDIYPMPDWDYYAYREYNEEGDHWYSRTDDHAYTMTRYEDLGFLALMPNLKQLYFACMEAGVLPDLSGSIKLESV